MTARRKTPGRHRTAAHKAACGLMWLLGAGAWLGVSGHHSFAAFDLDRERVLRGRVVEFRWIEPHTVTVLDVPGAEGSSDGVTDGSDAAVTRWTLEGMGPGFLGRRNWSRHTLEPGDEIEAVIYPLKDGSPGGTIARVTLADGSQRIMLNRRPE